MLPLLTDIGMFSRRFEQTGDNSDTSKAISVENRLVVCTPKGDPNLPERLANLGILFSTRFECTGDVSDISASISARERAVHLTPKDDEDMISLRTALGAYTCLAFPSPKTSTMCQSNIYPRERREAPVT